MNKKLLLVLPAALLVLGGCKGPEGGSTSSGTNTSEPAPAQTDWTDSEKAMMAEYWGAGVTFPFYYVQGYKLTDEYYEEYECLTVEAPNGKSSMITEYKSVLTKAGFTVAYDDTNEVDYGTKTLENGDEMQVQFYLNSGEWTIDVYVETPLPVLDAYPQAQIEAFLAENSITDTVPAIVGGTQFNFTTEEDEYGKFAYVAVLDASDSIFNTWLETLASNGYNVELNYLYALFYGIEAYDCVSDYGFGQIAITTYVTNGKLVAYMYLQDAVEPATAWPAETLATFLGEGAATVPAFAASAYYVSEITDYDENYDEVLVGYTIQVKALESETGSAEASIAATETVYKAALEAAGFYVDGSDYENNGYQSYDKDETVSVGFAYSNNIFTIVIQPYETGYTEVADVAAFNAVFTDNLKAGTPALPTFKDADLYAATVDDGTIYARLGYNGTGYTLEEVNALFTALDYELDDQYLEEYGFMTAYKCEDSAVQIYYAVENTLPEGFKQSVYLQVANVAAPGEFDLQAGEGYDSENSTADKATFVSGKASFSILKDRGSTAANNYIGGVGTATETRAYHDQALEISVEEGYVITGVTITIKSSSALFTNATVEGGTATFDEAKTTMTIVPNEGATTIKVSLASASSGNIKLMSAKVTYAAVVTE